jgi:hypothetical protein
MEKVVKLSLPNSHKMRTFYLLRDFTRFYQIEEHDEKH